MGINSHDVTSRVESSLILLHISQQDDLIKGTTIFKSLSRRQRSQNRNRSGLAASAALAVISNAWHGPISILAHGDTVLNAGS